MKNILYTLIFTLLGTQILLPQDKMQIMADKAADALLKGKNPVKGVVIGMIKGEKKIIAGYGELAPDKKANPEDMIFEIASITKNFTSLLLAESVSEGIIKYEENAVTLNNKNITWQNLVTHTAGIPNLPPNSDNSRDFKESDFEKFLSECILISEPGSKFSYSTAGFSLLGRLIAQKRGYKSFDNCIQDLILKPLGFNSSYLGPAGINPHLYTGDTLLVKKKKADYVFHPSGGLAAGAGDVMHLISINLNPGLYPKFTDAIKMTQRVIETLNTFMGSTAALGWHYYKDMKCYWNSGVSDQSRCVVMFDPASGCGVMLLSNTNLTSDVRLEMAAFGLLGQLRQIK